MSFFKRTVLALTCLAIFAISAHASATAVYIAQSATGAANGADCADAEPVSFFNSSGNWGSGPAQIGPGTTVHLCGTFTGAPNTTMLTFQGSGSSTSPVLLQFETGATFTSPYWGGNGAIYCNGFNYITIDGGSNGVVENSAAGSALSYSNVGSNGVSFNNCSHTEVRNLTVTNIYVRSGTGADGQSTNDIVYTGTSDFISAHNNTVNNARAGILISYNSLTSAQIYSNTTDYNGWSIFFGDNTSTATASGISIHDNNCGPHYSAWADGGFVIHLDGIFVFAVNGSSIQLSNSSIYNNFVHGDMSVSPASNGTAYIYLEGVGNETVNNVQIYNNVLADETAGSALEADLVLGTAGGNGPWNVSVYNNTFSAVARETNCLRIRSNGGEQGYIIKNNIFTGCNYGIDLWPNFTTMISASDYNVFSNLNYVADKNAGPGPPANYASIANWQAATNQDGASIGGILTLSSSYVPQSVAATCKGVNLYGLIPGLNFDKAGNPRPNNSNITCSDSSNYWTAGALQSGVSLPAPPSSVTATVN